ncbi:MAG: hypothetical protein HFI87_05690 [Bacilli bacterium]|nr:hypothetical protein [Bacilli bacterium]
MSIIPNVNAKAYSLSAIIVGYLLIDQSTPAEQNALGGWFMLVGQLLSTNSAQQQLLNNRNGTSNSSNRHIVNDDNLNNNSQNINESYVEQQIIMMQKVINAIQQEINNLKEKKL